MAIYLRANFLVIDDLPGRHAAEGLGLRVIGTLGLLVRAKHSGLIGEVRPLMDALIAHGLYTSAGLYHRILSLAGETEQLRFVEYGSTCRDFGNTQKRYGYHASSTRITRSHNHEHDPNFHR